MRATVTIDKEILDELLRETTAKSKAKAVNMAIAEYLRRKKVDRIKAMKGKLTFNVLVEDRSSNE
jgi:Arc/MetJ family transcription regulator